MAQAKILRFEDIERLTIEELVGNRELQRDIHYTIGRTRHGLSTAIPYMYPTVKVRHGSSRCTWHHNTFRIADGDHIYFFPEYWAPEEVPNYLREEDVIESGIDTLNLGNRKAVMDELGLSDRDFKLAIYNDDKDVLGRLGGKDIPFTKPVCRVAASGGVPKRYNARTQEWEQVGGRYKGPDEPND